LKDLLVIQSELAITKVEETREKKHQTLQKKNELRIRRINKNKKLNM